MLSLTLRRRARQFTRLVRRSAVTPRTGESHKPVLSRDGELAVTFIGHASFFVQVGGQNVLIDPNFAPWLFVLKRLRRPGLMVLDLKSRWMVPMHYGSFRLSHEPIDEPLKLLKKEARAAGVEDRVLVMEEGLTRFF